MSGNTVSLVQRHHPILVVSVRSFAVDTSKEKRIAGNTEYLPPLRRTGRGTGVVTRIETEKETATEIERMTEVSVAVAAAGRMKGSVVSVHNGKEAQGANAPTEMARQSEASAVAPAGMSQPPHVTDQEMPPPRPVPAGMMTTLVMPVPDVPIGKVPLLHPLIGNQTDPNAAIALAQRVRGETGQSGIVTQMTLLCPHPHTSTTNGLMTGSIWAPHLASPKGKEGKRTEKTESHLTMNLRRNSGKRTSGKRTGIGT